MRVEIIAPWDLLYTGDWNDSIPRVGDELIVDGTNGDTGILEVKSVRWIIRGRSGYWYRTAEVRVDIK